VKKAANYGAAIEVGSDAIELILKNQNYI